MNRPQHEHDKAGEKRVISGLGDAGSPTARGESVLPLSEATYKRALDCVHCGLCLPACPTYTDNGLEADSPRGRIMLMKGMADGRVEPTDAVLRHLDLCLDCRACETACPSGVVYHELIEETRELMNPRRPRSIVGKMVDTFFYHIFPYRRRVLLALLPARLLQKLGVWGLISRSPLIRRLPRSLQKMHQMLPPTGPVWESRLADRYPAQPHDPSLPTRRVAFLEGCIASVMFQEVNRQSVALLRRGGCEVLVPRAQRCCGAILHHGGRVPAAQALARTNIDAFLPRDGEPVDAIVTNVAGCGAMLKEYDHLLRDDPDYAERARQFVAKVRDISEYLAELDLGKPVAPVETRATYHDACHLIHAQKVGEAPRSLLSRVEGLEMRPLPESDMCCGAAGTYNIAEPEMAQRLAERKVRHIQSTGARMCITGNVGCAMQIQSEASRLGVDLTVAHPVTVLHRAYFGA